MTKPNDQPIDAIGADKVTTVPEVAPLFPFVADKIPAKVRAWLYPAVGVAMLAAWRYNLPSIGDELAFWSGILGLGIATSNVPRTTR